MITVIGSGSWGTALAAVLISNNHKVCLYGREQAVLKEIKEKQVNSKYLTNIKLFENADNLIITDSLHQSINKETQYIVLAIPSEACQSCIVTIKNIIDNNKLNNIPIIIASKGLVESNSNTEQSNPKWLHEVVSDIFDSNYPCCILSGPSFAKEVAQKQPTSIVMAAKDINVAQKASQIFHNNWFRVYTRDDVLGVEMGGALKNILAFAVGCAEGYGFGSNARAAIITRGLHEMLNLGNVLGVGSDTLMGLSGLGDLVLTATDNQSRNKRFGIYIGQGLELQQALDKVGQHVASYSTTKLIYNLAEQYIQKYKLDLPITTQAYKVLFENLDLKQAIENLASRPQKHE